jgi:hypothetical protein
MNKLRKSKLVSLRITPSQKKELNHCAYMDDISLSGYLWNCHLFYQGAKYGQNQKDRISSTPSATTD